jgi:hypothetical protein
MELMLQKQNHLRNYTDLFSFAGVRLVAGADFRAPFGFARVFAAGACAILGCCLGSGHWFILGSAGGKES